MRLIESGRIIGEVLSRPIVPNSIAKYKGVNYRVDGVATEDGDYAVHLSRRNEPCGQAATPDYVLDPGPPDIKPGHKIRVLSCFTEDYLGEVQVDSNEALLKLLRGRTVTINGKEYEIVDISIGERLHDELYVKDSKIKKKRRQQHDIHSDNAEGQGN
jgi:hypothetical protein